MLEMGIRGKGIRRTRIGDEVERDECTSGWHYNGFDVERSLLMSFTCLLFGVMILLFAAW